IVDAFSSLQANEFKSPATAEYYSGLVSHISDRVAGVDTSTYRIVSIPYDSLDQEKVARFRHQTVDGKTTSMKVDFYGNRPVELRPWHFLEEEAEDGSARVFVDHGRLSADLGREIDDPQMAHLTKALELMLEET
ncbi:hypothetical protein KA529_04760, partial [Candidatus Saccharibacteria bacterium]|nr:hypothetical protein [Candidatus Saccharibacteria bacterium]